MQRFIERFGALFGAFSMLVGMIGWLVIGDEPPSVADTSAVGNG